MITVDRFPVLTAGMPATHRGLFVAQVTELYAALDQGHIVRKRFASLKADLTRRIEAAYASALLPYCTQPGRLSRAEHKIETTIFDIRPTIGSLSKVIARIEVIDTRHPIQRAALSLLHEGLALATVFEALHDGDMIHDADLAQPTAQVVVMPASVPVGASSRSLVCALLHRVVEQESPALLVRLITDKPAMLHASLPVDPSEEIESLRVQYLTKNSRKMISLLDGKVSRHHVSLVRTDLTVHRPAVPGFDATLQFEFEDGSACAMRNTAIRKMSVYGRVFWQVSLFYLSARLADGTTLVRPSEQRIIQAFLAEPGLRRGSAQSSVSDHQTG